MEAVENTYEFLGEIAGVNYKYWVLRLDNQLLIHISQSNENPLDDLSVAMPGGQIATTIIGKCLIAQILNYTHLTLFPFQATTWTTQPQSDSLRNWPRSSTNRSLSA